jgi:peptide-methionine (R)-S-oxide reductase
METSSTMVVTVLALLLLVASQSVDAFQSHLAASTTTHRPFATTRLFSSTQETAKQYPIEKTEDEWKEILTPDQFYILRKEGTETPGASALNQISVEKNGEADAGTFCCAACQNPLFVASTKYDSGTGWPSFYAPVTNSAIDLNTDYKLVVPRSECVCSQCGGHLGHVFEGKRRKTKRCALHQPLRCPETRIHTRTV